ncbi:MAG: hypothetical protein WBQ45_18505 [Roseiarcus sp.]|uniref:hypothetical protein n=1 Tax=Roseiarcus sp. TaxID=1969460 RepID=UPI003C461D6E
MNGASVGAQTKILAFSVAVEIATGIASIVAPARVIELLLGTSDFGQLLPMARCFGVALLALGLACWPSRQSAANGSPALRGLLTYNALIALFLAYLGTVERVGGVLLWPAVALHAVVALMLARSKLGPTPARRPAN